MENNREPKFSDRQIDALEVLEKAIKQVEVESPQSGKLMQQLLASYKFDDRARFLTKEERRDPEFRLNVLAQHMLAAGPEIVGDKDALAEAIAYCPEGIGVWYDLGRDSHTYGLVPIPAEVMAKIINESPEVLGRLPENVISINRNIILEVMGNNKTILELPVIQKIMEQDKDFALKLKGNIIENLSIENERLVR